MYKVRREKRISKLEELEETSMWMQQSTPEKPGADAHCQGLCEPREGVLS
jgi:hypothetical protein